MIHNSIQLHKWQKRYIPFFILLAIFSFILSLCTSLSIFTGGIFLAIVMTLVFLWKSSSWIKKGERLSKELGLKMISIYPTTLTVQGREKIVEMHQRTSYLDGIKFFFKTKDQVKKIMSETLQEDFRKLKDWMDLSRASVVVITHEGMWRVWWRAAEPYLKVTQHPNNDPWIYFTLIGWWIVTWKTTGRVKWKRPKKGSWNLYVLECTGHEKETTN